MADIQMPQLQNYGALLSSFGEGLANTENANTNRLNAVSSLPVKRAEAENTQAQTGLTNAQTQGANIANQRALMQQGYYQHLLTNMQAPPVNDQSPQGASGSAAPNASPDASPTDGASPESLGSSSKKDKQFLNKDGMPSGDDDIDMSDGNLDPAHMALGAQQQFAVQNVWTPQEYQDLQLAMASGVPGASDTVKTMHDARIQSATVKAQQAASLAYERANAIATAPAGSALAALTRISPHPDIAPAIIALSKKYGWSPAETDEFVRSYATETGAAVHRYSGRNLVMGKDGIGRDEQTDRPVLGGTPEGVSAKDWSDLVKDGTSMVDTGAPQKVLKYRAAGYTSAVQYANAAAAYQAQGGKGDVPPSSSTLTPPPVTQPAGAAPQTNGQPSGGPSQDFSDAPSKPAFLSNPNVALTDYQKSVSKDYSDQEAALRAEANQLKNTQAEQVKNSRMLQLLPSAKTGPGTDVMSAVQTTLGNMTGSQFSSWLNSNPSAYALLSKQLGQSALDDRLKEMTSSGAQVKLGAQQDNLILNKLSASPEMPKAAIQSLLGWQAQQLQVDAARQKAIPAYIAQGRDAREFDSYYANKNPLQNSLSTAAPRGTTLPSRPGQQQAAPDKGGFIPGRRYTDKAGTSATYLGNGRWQ